jgi:hypothetical protein
VLISVIFSSQKIAAGQITPALFNIKIAVLSINKKTPRLREVFLLLCFVLFRSLLRLFGASAVEAETFLFYMSFHIVQLILSFSKNYCVLDRDTQYRLTYSSARTPQGVFQIELFHEQLPLPVPCYDLVPVTELTLGPAYADTSGTPGSLDLTGGEYKT